MPVTSIAYRSGPAPRAKPKAGGRRVTKKHGLQIRVHCMARSFSINQAPIGRLFSNGRPVFEWRKPEDLEVWDLHHLTPDEKRLAMMGKSIEDAALYGDTAVTPTKFSGLI